MLRNFSVADKNDIDSSSIDQTSLIGGGGVILKVKDQGITTGKIADSTVSTNDINTQAVTTSKLQNLSIETIKIANSAVVNDRILDNACNASKITALNEQMSLNTGSTLYAPTGSYIDIPDSFITVTTVGRPVFLSIISRHDTYSLGGGLRQVNPGEYVYVAIVRNSTIVANLKMQVDPGGSSWNFEYLTNTIDQAPTGTHTYKLQFKSNVNNYLPMISLVAYEL